jgi:hypothetical protein
VSVCAGAQPRKLLNHLVLGDSWQFGGEPLRLTRTTISNLERSKGILQYRKTPSEDTF